jgi:hypothetical protein
MVLTLMTFGLVYYTDNTPTPDIFLGCQAQLKRCAEQWGYPIISVSHKPIDLGKNIVVDFERSVLSMFKQMLIGIEACETDAIFMIEHDVIYHPSHFQFVPGEHDRFYYNRNMWNVSSLDGAAVWYKHNDISHLCAFRDLLLRHYRQVAKNVEEHGFDRRLGFSPPRGLPDDQRYGRHATYMSAIPNINIRHPNAFTRQRMTKEQFSGPNARRGWTESDSVPGWGVTKGRFSEILSSLIKEN